MSFKEILQKARQANQKTLPKEDLRVFWKIYAEEAQESLNEIRERRAAAITSESNIILG
mgnify:CR=1 FL=1